MGNVDIAQNSDLDFEAANLFRCPNQDYQHFLVISTCTQSRVRISIFQYHFQTILVSLLFYPFRQIKLRTATLLHSEIQDLDGIDPEDFVVHDAIL